MAKSIIVEEAKTLRKNMLTFNEYQQNSNEYNESHPNALSDGDEKGRGGDVSEKGTKTDINTRKKMLVMNKYTKNNEYKLED